jgi:prophage antirepressor-like protein
MKKQLQEFHSAEFGLLGVLMIDGKPYFPATECANALGYSNRRDAINRHCRWVVKHDVPHPQNPEKMISVNFIPEGDLYRLIIRSKLPAAERFEHWVFDEVLPSIRKHGAYIIDEILEEAAKSQEAAIELLGELLAERNKTAALTELTETLAPKALYCDLILQCRNVVPVSLISKDYGMSASAFNVLLHHLRIQYKTGGTWLLYQAHAGKGYTKSRTYVASETVSATHTYWTQKGRLFLYETLKSCGIVPLMESGRMAS